MKKRILAGLLSLVMILSVAPTAAFAADDGAELGITSAVVAEFRQNGSGTMQDVDITNGDQTLRWQYEAAYTVRVRINTEDGTTGRCLTVTLPQGMEFVKLADGGNTEVVERMEQEHGQPVPYARPQDNRTGDYQGGDGTVSIFIKESASVPIEIDFVVGIDPAFYDYSDNMLITDAIQLSYTDSIVKNGPTVEQDVTVCGAGELKWGSNAVADAALDEEMEWKVDVLGPGEEQHLLESICLSITTPAGVSYTGVTYDLGEMEEVQEIENDNGTTTRIWKLELPEGADAWYDDLTPPVVLQGLKFSSDALEDKESATISYEYTWDFYGDNADERKSQPLKQTIRLYDSKESATKLEVGKGNYLNWTAIGNEDGNFTEYAMQLAYGLIQTTGAGDTGRYTYEFDMSGAKNLAIYGVVIPAAVGKENSDYYPTEITWTGTEGSKGELTGDAISELVDTERTEYGILLKTEGLAGLKPGETLRTVTASIPKFPGNWLSYLDEGGGKKGMIGGSVWGAFRPEYAANPSQAQPITFTLRPEGSEGGTLRGTENVFQQQTGVDFKTDVKFFDAAGNPLPENEVVAGDSFQYTYTFTPVDNQLVITPQLYLREYADFKTTDIQLLDDKGVEVPFILEEVTNAAGLKEGETLYKLTLENPQVFGDYTDGFARGGSLTARVTVAVDRLADPTTRQMGDILWLKPSQFDEVQVVYGGRDDTCSVNGGKAVAGSTDKKITLRARNGLVAEAELRQGDGDWTNLGKDETKVAYAPGSDEGQYRVRVKNETVGSAVENVELYIPVPKQGWNPGADFTGTYGPFQFDMTATGILLPEEGGTEWKAFYTTDRDISKATWTEIGSGTELPETVTMFKVTADSLPAGETVYEIVVDVTADTARAGRENYFRSSYQCTNQKPDQTSFVAAEIPGEHQCLITFDKGDHGDLAGETGITVTAGGNLPSVPEVTPDDGWTFIGWKGEDGDTIYSASQLLDMPINSDMTFTAQYVDTKLCVVVSPAPITIYQGGKDGHEGVVDKDGQIVADNTSLPEPGFTVVLPDALKDAEATELVFREQNGKKTWKLAPYDGKVGTTVYKLVPQGDNQPATRILFTDAEGKTAVSDAFEVGEHINQTLTMRLYKGDVGAVIVQNGADTYYVDSSADAKLTVRGTTKDVSITSVSDTAPTGGNPGAVADADTTYTINKGNVQVDADADVSLLFDGIINSEGNDRTSQLQARAETYFRDKNTQPASGKEFAYEFKYLDLVDANNGNAWVAAKDAEGKGKDVTIYWPLPDGTNENTEFTLLHFEGLHREMTTGEIGNEISRCNVEDVQIVNVTGTHVVFEIGSAGFSPFALVWEQEKAAQQSYTVTFQGGKHGTLIGTTSYTVTADSVFGNDGRTVPTVNEKSNYDFTGWKDQNGNTYTSSDIMKLPITGDMTFTAQYKWDSSGDGGHTGGTTYYTLRYESNGGTEYDDERYAKNTVVDLDKVPTREGYTFTGWYADKELTERITEIKMTSNKTVYAGWEATGVPDWLNGRDHFAYVIGYADGTVRPLDNISRAEVATIIFRLLDPEIRDAYLTTSNTFEDVNEGKWYNTAISTLARLGIVYGRTDQVFDPEASITRAEFAAICARFDDSGIRAESSFSDIDGHWAEEEIEQAAALGWIRGYTDGTFRPNNTITRAEAMTLINRMLQRLPEDEDDLLPDMNAWPDNQPDDWYYLAVQEATNSHDFDRKGDGVHERWVRMTADPDWKEYE